MSSYSKKERAVASLLSKYPKAKYYLKFAYTSLFYFLYNPKYRFRIHSGYELTEVDSTGSDNFFGYYDKSPESIDGRYVIYQRAPFNTRKVPSDTANIEVVVLDRETNSEVITLKSRAFNWQQGTKLQWINSKCFIFNDYENGEYISRIVDVNLGKVICSLPLPIYDTFSDEYALTTSFERLSVLAPDYGYFAKEAIVKSDYDCDGVYWLCLKSKKKREIISLEKVSLFDNYIPENANHSINHIMISPGGKEFIFIHRWYVDGQRFDRLLLSDLEGNLHLLVNEDMVSHCCWLDKDNILGFFRYSSTDSYYKINIRTGEISPYGVGDYSDGHPTAYGDLVLTDTYPNRSGIQELLLIDKDGYRQVIAELKHSPYYFGESRCDLHPRLSSNGKRVYFDSVFSGVRKLYYIEEK
tara:strand:- start:2194 stop:3429 length:1236 start_codon:yes stop_codon:yes gene_type:complete